MVRIPQRYVYFAAPVGGGRVKIGLSAGPEARIFELAKWSPVDLEILASVPGTLRDECQVHYHFRDLWVRREWFEPSPHLLAFIREVASVGSLPRLTAPSEDVRRWRSATFYAVRLRNRGPRRKAA